MSDLTNIGLGTIRKIEDIWRAGKSESLIDYTQASRVSPLCLLDTDVMFDDITPSVMQTALSVFSGYYLQAWSLSLNIGRVEVMRTLDKLNPNRNPLDSATNTAGWLIATESLDADTPIVFGKTYAEDWRLAPSNYRYGLPTKQLQIGMEALGDLIVGRTDDDGAMLEGGAQNSRDVTKEIKELSNLAYGKLLSVEVTDGNNKGTVNVSVNLGTSSIPSDRLIDLLSTGSEDNSAKERYHGWKSGRLEAIKDMIFCEDLISAHRKNLMKDHDNLYSSMLERQSKNRLAAVFSANPSIAQASNIVIISAETAARLERQINGKLKDFHTRQKLFDKTYIMIFIVVEKDWGRATFYSKGIEHGSTVSQREMDASNKSGGPNVSDILRAYSLGQNPTIS